MSAPPRDENRLKNDPDQQGVPDVALSDEAIDWLVALNSGRATDQDRASFAEWRARSAAHELAAREAEAVWHGVGIAGDRARTSERKASRAKLTRRAVVGGGVLVAGGWALGQSGALSIRGFADHVTSMGERRSVMLPDGSSVLLNAGTALSVNFGEGKRALRLLAGEATFTVRPDPSRPFVVEAGGGRTRAVGTAFHSDIRPGETVVTVLEGVVEVTGAASATEAVVVRADQRVRYAASGRLSTPQAVDADIETAWRRGKLIFNRRPLGDVVAEIERYRSGTIIIGGTRLRTLEVTGVFDLDDPEAILRTIEETLPVRALRLPLVTVLHGAGGV